MDSGWRRHSHLSLKSCRTELPSYSKCTQHLKSPLMPLCAHRTFSNGKKSCRGLNGTNAYCCWLYTSSSTILLNGAWHNMYIFSGVPGSAFYTLHFFFVSFLFSFFYPSSEKRNKLKVSSFHMHHLLWAHTHTQWICVRQTLPINQCDRQASV